MAEKKVVKIAAQNRKAHHDYFVEDVMLQRRLSNKASERRTKIAIELTLQDLP